MRQITWAQVQDEITVCPYCMNPARNRIACCGESSAHFQTAYDLGDELVLAEEVEVVDESSRVKRES